MTDRQTFYDERAPLRIKESQREYHRLLQGYFRFFIPAGSTVLELGCGLGDLLNVVQPSRGVGVDFSTKMIGLARQRYPKLEFHVADAAEFGRDETFDYIIISDLVNDVPDVQHLLDVARRHSNSQTRVVINFFNNLWRPTLAFSEAIGAKAPTLLQNWLSLGDVQNLLHLAGWEVIKTDTRILWPVGTPLVGTLLNRWFAPLLKHLCLTVFIVARPKPDVPPDRLRLQRPQRPEPVPGEPRVPSDFEAGPGRLSSGREGAGVRTHVVRASWRAVRR